MLLSDFIISVFQSFLLSYFFSFLLLITLIAQVNWKHQSLPLARIKKIMKSDEVILSEMERERENASGGASSCTSPLNQPSSHSSNQRFMIAGEAPILLSKACEMMVKELSVRAWRYTEKNRRRTLQKQDIHAAVAESDVYDFLIDIVPRVSLQPGQQTLNYLDQNPMVVATSTATISTPPMATTTSAPAAPTPAVDFHQMHYNMMVQQQQQHQHHQQQQQQHHQQQHQQPHQQQHLQLQGSDQQQQMMMFMPKVQPHLQQPQAQTVVNQQQEQQQQQMDEQSHQQQESQVHNMMSAGQDSTPNHR